MWDLLLLFILFPLVCGFIGWVTNVVAVRMIFWPHDPVRFGPLSFQGVLPKNLNFFARILSKIITKEFITTSQMVRGLNPARLGKDINAFLGMTLDALLPKLRSTLPPGLQGLLTPETTNMLREVLDKEGEANLPQAIEVLAGHADNLLDLRQLTWDKLVEMGPKRLEEIIYEVSAKELNFIVVYGGYFGAALGLIQFVMIQVADIRDVLSIVLPVVGVVESGPAAR